MNSICIPVPSLRAGQIVELDVSIDGHRHQLQYRVERFQTAAQADATMIDQLRTFISNYDRQWQLVQIGAPEGTAIPVMFRHQPDPVHR